jgi:CHRD domain
VPLNMLASRRRLGVSLLAGAAAVAGVAAIGVTVRSEPEPSDQGLASNPTAALVGNRNQPRSAAAARAVAPSLTGPDEDAVFLAAEMTGQNEVPQPDGTGGGDLDGRAVSVLRIADNQVCYSVAWSGIDAPTLGHIHVGEKGVNGDPIVNLFTKAMPANARAAAGCVPVDDAKIQAIAKQPDAFYANLRTAEFSEGAVRGQYRRLDDSVQLDSFVNGQLMSVGDGTAVVPDRGDPRAGFLGVVTPRDGQVEFAMKLFGTAAPTSGRLDVGGAGQASDPVLNLFEAPDGLAPELFAIAGVTVVDNAELLRAIGEQPQEFNLSLFSPQFPGGLARGQLEVNGQVQAPAEDVDTTDSRSGGVVDRTDTIDRTEARRRAVVSPTDEPERVPSDNLGFLEDLL